MTRIRNLLAATATIGALASGGAARAQYVGPVNPYYPPPPYQAPTVPYYNPNGVANMTGNSSSYWDPQRGWVTNTQNTTVLNSATSPWRAPANPAQVQYYNYWDGTQWVRGSYWIGQDGLPHGQDDRTQVGPNGSISNSTVYRSAPAPSRPGAGPSQPQGGVQQPQSWNTYRPVYVQPRSPYPASRPGYVMPGR